MHKKFALISVLLVSVLAASSCSSEQVDSPVDRTEITSVTSTASVAITTSANPVGPTTFTITDNPDSGAAPVEPRWQLCTWTLYGLYAEPPAAHPGQPVTVWAHVYVEDWPTTDILADLLVNGRVVEHRILTVNFDEAWPFKFVFIPDRAGVYDITVRAILAENAAFAAAPGGDRNYYTISIALPVMG